MKAKARGVLQVTLMHHRRNHCDWVLQVAPVASFLLLELLVSAEPLAASFLLAFLAPVAEPLAASFLLAFLLLGPLVLALELELARALERVRLPARLLLPLGHRRWHLCRR